MLKYKIILPTLMFKHPPSPNQIPQTIGLRKIMVLERDNN